MAKEREGCRKRKGREEAEVEWKKEGERERESERVKKQNIIFWNWVNVDLMCFVTLEMSYDPMDRLLASHTTYGIWEL